MGITIRQYYRITPKPQTGNPAGPQHPRQEPKDIEKERITGGRTAPYRLRTTQNIKPGKCPSMQTLNEKIEERNEDLHKLKKKTTTMVQILTHTR
jgi:hypothetical protein